MLISVVCNSEPWLGQHLIRAVMAMSRNSGKWENSGIKYLYWSGVNTGKSNLHAEMRIHQSVQVGLTSVTTWNDLHWEARAEEDEWPLRHNRIFKSHERLQDSMWVCLLYCWCTGRECQVHIHTFLARDAKGKLWPFPDYVKINILTWKNIF